jgi:hypothetical protein
MGDSENLLQIFSRDELGSLQLKLRHVQKGGMLSHFESISIAVQVPSTCPRVGFRISHSSRDICGQSKRGGRLDKSAPLIKQIKPYSQKSCPLLVDVQQPAQASRLDVYELPETTLTFILVKCLLTILLNRT